MRCLLTSGVYQIATKLGERIILFRQLVFVLRYLCPSFFLSGWFFSLCPWKLLCPSPWLTPWAQRKAGKRSGVECISFLSVLFNNLPPSGDFKTTNLLLHSSGQLKVQSEFYGVWSQAVSRAASPLRLERTVFGCLSQLQGCCVAWFRSSLHYTPHLDQQICHSDSQLTWLIYKDSVTSGPAQKILDDSPSHNS